MKTNVKLNVQFFALLCLLAVPLMHSSSCKAHYDENRLAHLVQEFLDVHSCNKSFEQFALEFQQLLAGNPQYVSFCSELNKIKKSRNSNIVAMTLLKYKGIMPAHIKNILTAKQNQLLDIVKRRVQA